MKLTEPVLRTKECCQEHAGEIFNIKLAIRFKETWEQIKFLNSRYGDFQVKFLIQLNYCKQFCLINLAGFRAEELSNMG